MRAVWRDTVLAESDATIIIEGNHYFPANSLRREYVLPSEHHTTCPWKGKASYMDVKVGDEVNPNAAWYYPAPLAAAAGITGYFAFWQGIVVTD